VGYNSKNRTKEILALGKKIDYKKDYKQLYMPKTLPEIVVVPRMPFYMVSGSGNPNGEEFAMAIEALYSMSYAVRMSYKSENVPAGYYEYTVFHLRANGTCLIGQSLRQTKAILSTRL
jgi:hypothetical protein